MELHDNHIWIYSRILQVSQSLNRDNHGIFISLILFENMTALWATCNFSFCESLPSPLPSAPGLSETGIFTSVSEAQEDCQKERKTRLKNDTRTPPPPENSVCPILSWMQGQSDTAEKLQLVIFFCLNPPPMLSCLQVNLSWGICHGSSCFCI